MVKAKQALHVAEHLWEDTISDGSMFDTMIKVSPYIEKMKKDGKTKEVESQIIEMRSEVIARWANIILEAENHRHV